MLQLFLPVMLEVEKPELVSGNHVGKLQKRLLWATFPLLVEISA